MPADPVAHPETQVLQAFALGKLPEAEMNRVSRHLESCADCRAVLQDVPADSFLKQIQIVKPQGAKTQLPRPHPARGDGESRLFSPRNTPPADLQAPPELAGHSKFRLVKELGRGGMGVVYQAEHRTMERPVAIKVISEDILDHPDALTRFHAEVKAAARLNHPNIVQAFDAEQAGSLHMLVMEFVEGISLAEYLDRKGPLPVGLACHFARQAALGLHHAFDKGMVHRDIKPRNLMITPKGQVKILDFGLARMASERGKESRLTRHGDFMGTPEYVAPEQATDASTADIRADLYSLGCSLYCLLAGRPPFQEDTAVKLILAHLDKAPTPLRTYRSDVPDELWAVIAQLLAKQPGDRYQTPAEVAKDLLSFAKVFPRAGSGERPVVSSPNAGSPGGGMKGAREGRSIPTQRSRVTPPPLRSDTQLDSPFDGLAEEVQPSRKTETPTKRPDAKRGKLWAVVGVASALVTIGVVAGVAIWAQSTSRTPPEPNQRNPAKQEQRAGEAKDTFVQLFNGKDLTGWVVDGGDESNWQLKANELVVQGTEEGHFRSQDYLLTQREYTDFCLRFQFLQTSELANSGIAVRAMPGETQRDSDPRPGDSFPYHLTIWIGKRPLDGSEATGGLWWSPNSADTPPLGPDSQAAVRPVGEWNDMEIEMRGQALRIVVNGREIQNVMLNKTRPEKFPAKGLSRYQGRIGILKRRGEVHFRKVEIKELSHEQSTTK